jgi:hypothetical protein
MVAECYRAETRAVLLRLDNVGCIRRDGQCESRSTSSLPRAVRLARTLGPAF